VLDQITSSIMEFYLLPPILLFALRPRTHFSEEEVLPVTSIQSIYIFNWRTPHHLNVAMEHKRDTFSADKSRVRWTLSQIASRLPAYSNIRCTIYSMHVNGHFSFSTSHASPPVTTNSVLGLARTALPMSEAISKMYPCHQYDSRT